MASPNLIQSSELPPAQPTYVLRGHSAQVHAVHFFRNNTRLLTGDADGWVVVWSTATKRAVTVWKPHHSTILGVGSWGQDNIITHGRDNKLKVWQLRQHDETDFSKQLPIDDAASERKHPWLLHSLEVNALNFCSFASTQDLRLSPSTTSDSSSTAPDILIATPGLQDGHVNITSLPSEARIATIPGPRGLETGMVMAIQLHFHNSHLLALAGYESGHACVFQHPKSPHELRWELKYSHKAHAQPILSLALSPSASCFFTSAADAVIARHPLGQSGAEPKTLQTKHAGQQGLTVRDDDKIFATAGWDGRARVYSVKTMKELAVLKWHKEGCYAIAFAAVSEDPSRAAARDETAAVTKELTVAAKRAEVARTTHWLAAGSKDGKVSLWDIY